MSLYVNMCKYVWPSYIKSRVKYMANGCFIHLTNRMPHYTFVWKVLKIGYNLESEEMNIFSFYRYSNE